MSLEGQLPGQRAVGQHAPDLARARARGFKDQVTPVRRPPRAFVASGIAGQLHFRQENPAGTVNDKTIVEGDINGDKVADFQIELTGLKALAAADFIL